MRTLIIGVIVIAAAAFGYFKFFGGRGKTFEMKGENSQSVKVEVLAEGTGEGAKNGKRLTVNYAGYLADGKKFDSSFDRNRPFSFTLGVGQVIRGWDLGMDGMKVGGKRKLVIPPELAYGERGAGTVIPPNSTLTFEVELLEIK